MSQSSFHREELPGQPKNSDKPIVLLSLKNKADRDLFINQLSNKYDFVQGDLEECDGDYDACILDYNSYSNHRDVIIKLKESIAPLFVPFILLIKNEKGSNYLNPDTEIIDEVVGIPTQIAVMVSRIEAMLTIRRHTITLKQKNRELQEKNARLNLYEQALDSANSGIVITDSKQKDNPITYLNKAFLEITGYDKSEVIGQNCRFLQNNDRDQDAIKEVRSLIDNNKEGSVTLRNYRKDGTLFWNELKIAPIKDNNGQVNYFVGIQNDITQEIKNLDKISEERNLFKKLTDSSPIGIVIINKEGQITFANNQAEGILGLKKSKIEELTYDDPSWDIRDVNGGPYPVDQLPFSLVMSKNKAVYNVMHQIRWPDGTVKILSVNAAPLFDRKGDLDAVVASISDITENEISKIKLKESIKEKEILMQEIHHRVKNNLAVISGLLQIQRFNSDDEKLNKALEESEMRIKSMALIHEKLYQAETLSEINFKQYIEDLVNVVVNTIEISCNITTTCHCESMKINVNQAIPCALIINELLSNAAEHAFTDQEEGKIEVILKKREGRVYLTVKDNGKGLPKRFLNLEATSMGTTIIQALISQLDADFEASNDNGARIEFSFIKKAVKGSGSSLL